MRVLKIRIPRPIRWTLVLVALLAGWAAGGYLQSQAALRDLPQTQPTTQAAER